MGKRDRAVAALPPATLEDLVPLDSFARHLERSLDLSFVGEAYAKTGRPRIDPVIFFDLQRMLSLDATNVAADAALAAGPG